MWLKFALFEKMYGFNDHKLSIMYVSSLSFYKK